MDSDKKVDGLFVNGHASKDFFGGYFKCVGDPGEDYLGDIAHLGFWENWRANPSRSIENQG